MPPGPSPSPGRDLNRKPQQAGASPDPVRIFLCGDVMTGRGIDQILAHPSPPEIHEAWMSSAEDYVRLAERRSGPIPRKVGPEYVWGAAMEAWAQAAPNVRIVNLETSVTRSEAFEPKGINYRMDPANLDCLTAAGLDCCVLANNHVLDWGRDGLNETLEALHGRGVATAGAGRDLAEAQAPASIDLENGAQVIVVGLGVTSSGIAPDWAAEPGRPGVQLTGLSPRAAEDLGRRLETIRRPGDVLVVSIHWGPNWGYGIADDERRFAHALIERAGADVVHGHSSHHPKAIEVHRDRPILYGCGDFLNDYEGIEGYEQYRPGLALMYFIDLEPGSGQMRALQLLPLKIRRFRLETASEDELRWLQERLDREARRFGGRILREGAQLRWAAASSRDS